MRNLRSGRPTLEGSRTNRRLSLDLSGWILIIFILKMVHSVTLGKLYDLQHARNRVKLYKNVTILICRTDYPTFIFDATIVVDQVLSTLLMVLAISDFLISLTRRVNSMYGRQDPHGP